MFKQVETLHVNTKVDFDVLRDKFEVVKHNEFGASGDAPFSGIFKTVRDQINLEQAKSRKSAPALARAASSATLQTAV